MRFSVRGKVEWLITRCMLINLVSTWLRKLEQIDLPDVGIALGQRDVAQEHALSLEFDGPKNQTQALHPSALASRLLYEVTLTVDAFGTQLHLSGQGQGNTMRLTRKESHALLEMLTTKARAAKWTDAVDWPDSLGASLQK